MLIYEKIEKKGPPNCSEFGNSLPEPTEPTVCQNSLAEPTQTNLSVHHYTSYIPKWHLLFPPPFSVSLKSVFKKPLEIEYPPAECNIDLTITSFKLNHALLPLAPWLG